MKMHVFALMKYQELFRNSGTILPLNCFKSETRLANKEQMNMEVEKYITRQPADRQTILSNIHATIIGNDKSVIAEVGSMKGKK